MIRFNLFIALALALLQLAFAQAAPQTDTKTDFAASAKIRTFGLKHADAFAATRMINAIIPKHTKATVSFDTVSNSLIVTADEETLHWVEGVIKQYDLDTKQRNDGKLPDVLELVQLPLRQVDANEMLRVAEQLGLADELSIVVAPQTNALVARGTASQLAEIQAFVAELDQPQTQSPANAERVRVKLDVDGRAFIADRELSLDPGVVSLESGQTVIIDVDRGVDYKHVVDWIGRLKESGANRFAFRELEQPAQLEPKTNADPYTAKVDTGVPASKQGKRDATSVLRAAYESAERQAAKLAEQWREQQQKNSADKGALTKIDANLDKEVAAAFRLRQQWQWEQLEEHQQELNRLREQLSRRERIAERIIEHRKRELQTGDDLTWLPEKSRSSTEVKKSTERRESQSSRVAGPGPGVLPTNPIDQEPRKLVEISDDGGTMTITGRSEDHLNELENAFNERANQALEDLVPDHQHPDDRSLILRSSTHRLQQIAAIVEDFEVVRALQESIKSATDVPIQLIGATGLTAKWTFADTTIELPARFFLDAGDQLALTLFNRGTDHEYGVYASIRIHDLSDRARQYFKTHPLRIGFSLADFGLARSGRATSKLFFLEENGEALRLQTYDSKAVPISDRKSLGELVAELHPGNNRPLTSDIYPTQNRNASSTDFVSHDSVVFVEMIVSPSGDAEDQRQKAIYMDGTVVGDDGLVAVIIDELLDDAGNLAVRIDSVTIKTSTGAVIHDASIVAHDASSGLGLLRSGRIPVPAMRLDGPSVVASQGVIVLGRSGITKDTTTFEKIGLQQDTRVEYPLGSREEFPEHFALPFIGGSPGAAVTLTTTGQLIGILSHRVKLEAENQDRYFGSLVVPVATVDELVRKYRQNDF